MYSVDTSEFFANSLENVCCRTRDLYKLGVDATLMFELMSYIVVVVLWLYCGEKHRSDCEFE